jgi:hypothetical protein
MKKDKKWNGMFLTAMLAVTLTFALVLAGCGNKDDGDPTSPSDTRTTLTAGSAVEVAASATTADAKFTGATGLTGLVAADFTVTETGGSISNVSVSGGEAIVTVTFAANTGETAKTYTVSIAAGSTKIKGSTTVTITQEGGPDNRTALTAGSAVDVAASATTADAKFTGATGLDLAAADFTVTGTGGSISNVSVSDDEATVTVSFAANTSDTSTKTYTVSIASTSTKIKGNGTVTITQNKVLPFSFTAVTPGTGAGQTGFTTDIQGVAYGNGTFVAVGESPSYTGRIMYSTDGITWTEGTGAVPAYTVYSIVYGDKFVAGAGGTVSHSTDGITWSAATTQPASFGIFKGIAWNGTLYVAVDNGGEIATSPDGDVWTVVPGTPSISSFYDVAYGAGKFVAVATGKMLSSPDGTTWTEIPSHTFGSSGSTGYINCIAFVDNKFFAGGRENWKTKLVTSSTGESGSWVDIMDGSSDSYAINAVAYGGGKLIVGGMSATIKSSTDGTTFTSVTGWGDSGEIIGVAFGGGKFVAVGASGRIAYSN